MTPTLPTKAAEGRPEGIPPDVWDAASLAADFIETEITDLVDWDSRAGITMMVATVILAERERCATIQPVQHVELPGGTYGLAMIEAYWKGVAAGKEAIRAAIRGAS